VYLYIPKFQSYKEAKVESNKKKSSHPMTTEKGAEDANAPILSPAYKTPSVAMQSPIRPTKKRMGMENGYVSRVKESLETDRLVGLVFLRLC